ncbi:MAG TPA: hypothetical protein GX708_04505 [Gallicola sp.]|nr:hypothetical protein [Gallicola sp.]
MANDMKNIKTTRLKVGAYKAVGTIVPIIFLFYLVLYLKENGFSSQSYFADYENAVSVWSVGLDLFRTIMNTLDLIAEVLGKIVDFIVDFVDDIINWIKDVIDGFGGVTNQSLFDRLAEWARSVISGLMF